MAEKACIKRLQKEYRALCKEPVSHVVARPSPNDILEWHYVLEGSEGTPFAGGYYYGKIKFPPEYPYKPPGITMTTPNGRFITQKKICLSMSDFHPESWNPMWSVSSILTGLLSFMMDTSPTTGSVNTTVDEKQRLAKSSLAFNCKTPAFRKLFPEYVEKYNQQQLAEQAQQTAPESPQENNGKAESEKTVDTTKEDSDGGLKERRKNKKQGLPAWIILLLVSVFGLSSLKLSIRQLGDLAKPLWSLDKGRSFLIKAWLLMSSKKYLQRNWASWESGTGAQFPKRLLNRVRVSIHRHPSRPDIGDIEAATPLIQYIEKDDQNRLDVIDRQVKSSEVSPELFNVLKEMRRGLVRFQSKEHKRDAAKVLDFGSAHVLFDELLQRASDCIASPTSSNVTTTTIRLRPRSSLRSVTDSTLEAKKLTGHSREKMSLIKLATLIELSAKKATQELNLQHKLMDQIEWLPDSIGKIASRHYLQGTNSVNLSVLPESIGSIEASRSSILKQTISERFLIASQAVLP
ncbi:hypothetical protein Bca52824_034035 [Brassica carinata]|uniref:E2 ubiquitin-conjugating enzyme n=1 Tax=Brassica carinata TaxID=52824 RepID=A0A8X7V7L9_BRACI|nr:hypothetical protein Bca52824_034035 [Brassica carinata]